MFSCLGEIVTIEYEICNNRDYPLNEIELVVSLSEGLELLDIGSLGDGFETIPDDTLLPEDCKNYSILLEIGEDVSLYEQDLNASLTISPDGCNKTEIIDYIIVPTENAQTLNFGYVVNEDNKILLQMEVCNISDDLVENLILQLSIPSSITIDNVGEFYPVQDGVETNLTLLPGECKNLVVRILDPNCICDIFDFTANLLSCNSPSETIEFDSDEFYFLGVSAQFSNDCSLLLAEILDSEICFDYQWKVNSQSPISGTTIDEELLQLGNNTIEVTAVAPCGTTSIEVYNIDNDCINLECPTDNETIYVLDDNNNLFSDVFNDPANGLTNPVINQTFYIENNLEIDMGVTFQNCTFFFENGSELNISEADDQVSFLFSHLTACDQFWDGVDLEDSANVQFRFGTTIENAITAIEASSGAVDLVFYRSEILDCLTGGRFVNADHDILFDESNITFNEFNIDLPSGSVPRGLIFNEVDNVSRIRRSHFTNLFTGINISGSAVEVKNGCTFSDIGNSNELIWDEIAGNATAIEANDNSNVMVNHGNVFANCSRGIVASNSNLSITHQNVFDVFTHAIACEGPTSIVDVRNNEIVAKRVGIGFTTGFIEIYDNEIQISNSGFGNIGIGIDLSRLVGGHINSNSITMLSGTDGMQIRNCKRVGVRENTILQDGVIINMRDGIAIEGSELNMLFRCNRIANATNTDWHFGISVNLSNDIDLILNEIEGQWIGMDFHELSGMHFLIENNFIGGHLGLDISSVLGEQEHHGNEWQDGWDIAVRSDLSADDNTNSRFITDCNVDKYCPDPNLVEAIGQLFDDQDGVVTHSTPCTNNPGDDDEEVNLHDPIDELEFLCEGIMNNDSLSCEEQWLENYQLYSLVKSIKDTTKLTKTRCLNAFLVGIASTDIVTFYTIDSLLTSNIDSNYLLDIDSLFNGLLIAVDDSDDNAANLYSQIIKTQSTKADSLWNNQLNVADSLLTTIRDTCMLTEVWKTVFETIVHETIYGYNRDSSTIDYMHNIAQYCPSDIGKVIFYARDYMNSINEKEYINECQNTAVVQREKSNISTNEFEISIYPNPVYNTLNIDTDLKQISKISLYNLSGIEVKSASLNIGIKTTIDVTDIPIGMYIITIHSSKHTYTQKIIIQ